MIGDKANLSLEPTAFCGVGFSSRSMEDSSTTGPQVEVGLGPKVRSGPHSVSLEALYQYAALHHGMMSERGPWMVHTVGGRLDYGHAVSQRISLHAHVGMGWANYEDRFKEKKEGFGFSASVRVEDGLHLQAGGAICLLDDRLCLAGNYSRDYSIYRIALNSGWVGPPVIRSYDVDGIGILLQVGLARR